MVSSLTLNGSSLYPGALVAIPTLGAGLVVAAGAAAPTWGVERLLRRKTFQFLAAISFPLYLWHWPILEIAAQSRGVMSLSVWDNVGLLLVAGVLATLTYYFFENPIRHSRFLARRRWASIIMGLCLIAATLAVTTYEQRRPTVNLGILTTVTSGSTCLSPPQSSRVALEIDVYVSIASRDGGGTALRDEGERSAAGAPRRRFDRLYFAPGIPSRRAVIWIAIRERGSHRLRGCQWPRRPCLCPWH